MGILDFLKPATHAEPVLGTLVRRGGYWRGEIKLDAAGPVPLVLAGSRSAPDASSVTLARELALRYPALRPAIERALFEHYEPYAEAAEGHAEQTNDVPKLSRSDQVWDHVSLVRILIEPLDHVDTVEIAYEAGWDVEHMLGARFQGWVLVELNGSVVQGRLHFPLPATEKAMLARKGRHATHLEATTGSPSASTLIRRTCRTSADH